MSGNLYEESSVFSQHLQMDKEAYFWEATPCKQNVGDKGTGWKREHGPRRTTDSFFVIKVTHAQWTGEVAGVEVNSNFLPREVKNITLS